MFRVGIKMKSYISGILITRTEYTFRFLRYWMVLRCCRIFSEICRVFRALKSHFLPNLAAYFSKFCRIFLRSLGVIPKRLCPKTAARRPIRKLFGMERFWLLVDSWPFFGTRPFWERPFSHVTGLDSCPASYYTTFRAISRPELSTSMRRGTR